MADHSMTRVSVVAALQEINKISLTLGRLMITPTMNVDQFCERIEDIEAALSDARAELDQAKRAARRATTPKIRLVTCPSGE